MPAEDTTTEHLAIFGCQQVGHHQISLRRASPRPKIVPDRDRKAEMGRPTSRTIKPQQDFDTGEAKMADIRAPIIITEKLEDQEYIRQRIEPRPGDPFYLHLSDLLLAVTEVIPSNVDRILDYGCGGSPYRRLFNARTYHRADLVGGDSLDFEYDESSRLSANSLYYDCVLSSQVLEHVSSPMHYLEECYRVLKPGGKLILSTHGLFEDHSCPADYWRWTAMGLNKLVETVGFNVEKVRKLTTGPRAAVFFAERTEFGMEFWRTRRYFRTVLCGLRMIQGVGARRRHLACDTCFPKYRVVDASAAGHSTYIAIALTARR